MEKQHNRGQDGAGIAAVKLNTEPGYPYLHRIRSIAPQAIADIFAQVGRQMEEIAEFHPDIEKYPGLMKGHYDFLGELLLGHLRYGTQGKNNVSFCHPFIKRNTLPGRNLAMAGNFNIINKEELFALINSEREQTEKQSDLAAIMDVIHHFLGKEDEQSPEGADIISVLKESVPHFDGGFTFGGLTGNGIGFVVRDAHGIRPCYYYADDEIVVAASERAAIRTAFNLDENEVKELMPGSALIVSNNGDYSINQIIEPRERRACSFERIYFSRGSDEKIYRERIALGYHLSERVLQAVDHDLKNTIFSYIPNTAETAFYGLIKGAEDYLNKIKIERILSWEKDFDEEKLTEMVNRKIRMEKIAIKDVKLRTFISEDKGRDEMVQHVYDITYGTVRKDVDTLVIIDDSIVRGTTLRESIIRMLARLHPKKIIIVSSSPQIRYPDCYGIDMSRMGEFVAFRAAIALMKETNNECALKNIYNKCIELKHAGKLNTVNLVRDIYQPFSLQEISDKIAQLVTPPEVSIPVQVIFQTIEDLHESCPTNLGDWYFTGNYPTPGGNRVVNTAFINYIEGNNARGY